MATATNPDRDAYFAAAMAAAQRGDGVAYRELLEAVRVLLTAYSRRVLTRMGLAKTEAVEDLVQEIMVALHLKRHTYDPGQPFLAWLFAIARYKLIDYGRAERRKGRAVPLHDVEDALAAPVFTGAGAAADVQELLSILPEKARRAVTLLKLEELSVAEAAAATQMSESALKVTVHRALKSLRQRLVKSGAVDAP